MSAPVTPLRALAGAFLLDTLAQAALTGLFVTGNVDLLAWHDANAQLLAATAALLVLVLGRLAAETGTTLFRVAFARWINEPDQPDLPGALRASTQELRNVLAEGTPA